MRVWLACLVVCIAAAQGDACPIANEGGWPWVADYVLRGARFDPDTKGPIAIPPRPRIVVLRRSKYVSLPRFRTPQGRNIPRSVTACGQLVLVDLKIESGTVIVQDIDRPADTQTFVIRDGLSAATRRADLAKDGFARLVPDSDAVAFRVDNADGTQAVQFNGPYIALPQGWRGTRVVALYANGTEEVVFGRLAPLRTGRSALALCLSLLGLIVLVELARRES